MSSSYPKSQTQVDYAWPRVLPVCVKPSQPPVKTGVRLYCPEPDTSVCKQQDYQVIRDKQRSSSEQKRNEEKNHVSLFMNRKELMSKYKNVRVNCRAADDCRLKSIYQTDYAKNMMSYDDLMNEIHGGEEDRATTRKKCSAIDKIYVDPTDFKKFIDKEYVFPMRLTFDYTKDR